MVPIDAGAIGRNGRVGYLVAAKAADLFPSLTRQYEQADDIAVGGFAKRPPDRYEFGIREDTGSAAAFICTGGAPHRVEPIIPEQAFCDDPSEERGQG